MQAFDAILPAGGRIDADFAAKAGTDVKALIPMGGKTLLEHALDSVLESGRVRRTVVIGSDPVRELARARGVLELPEASTGPENIFAGLDALAADGGASERVIVCTTDMPYLTPDRVNDFLDRCPPDRDLAVALIRRADYEARFPGSTATFVKLRDDSWTTGGIFLLNASAMRRVRPQIERVFDNRKSKAGMARLLGPTFVLKWLLGRLTVSDVEAKIRGMLGCSGSAVRGCDPVLAYDIDFLDDYEYAMARGSSF